MRVGSAHSQYLRFTSPKAPGVLFDAMIDGYLILIFEDMR